MKNVKEKIDPCVCVCGQVPVIVKIKGKYMLSCLDQDKCAMRSRWKTNEQAAVDDWNNAIKSARHEKEEHGQSKRI